MQFNHTKVMTLRGSLIALLFVLSIHNYGCGEAATLQIPLDNGWLNETYQGGRAFRNVSSDPDGNLIIRSKFHPRSSTQGEVFFELENLDSTRGHTDFTGAKISISFVVPGELVAREKRSGAQIFLETENPDGKIARQYSPWKNLHSRGKKTVHFRPRMTGDMRGYYTDPAFDVERAVAIGFKLSLGGGSFLQYDGPVRITSVRITWPDSAKIQEEKTLMAEEQVYYRDEIERFEADSLGPDLRLPVSPPAPDLSINTIRRIEYDDGLSALSAVSDIENLGQPYDNGLQILRISVDFERYGDDIKERSARIERRLPSPIDVRKRKFRVWFAVDLPLRGVLSRPNRVSLELTDVNGKLMRGPWTNASVKAYKWDVVELVPTVDVPMPLGTAESGFDMSRVEKIGARFERGRFSHLIHKVPYPNLPPYSLQGKLFLSEIIVTEADVPVSKTVAPTLPACPEPTIEPVPRNEFIIGVNYAWIHYGWDIGKNPYGGRQTGGFSTHRMRLEKDFKMLAEHGVNLVRFFTLSDLRTGITYDAASGLPSGLDNHTKADLKAIAEVAHKNGIRLMPVILDFLSADGIQYRDLGNDMTWEEGERPEVIMDETFQKAFLDSCVRPFVREIKRLNDTYKGVIYAVDIGNELGNAKAVTTPKNFPHLRQFVKKAIQIVRREAPELKVTLGARNRADLVNYWQDMDLDIWQYHYYDDFEQEGELKLDYPASCLKLDGPVILSEVDPSNIKSKLDIIHRNGYLGALFWSLHERDGFKIDLAAIQEWKKGSGSFE